MPKPDGPQWDAHTLELFNAAKRRMESMTQHPDGRIALTGKGSSGPVGPLDADIIDRASFAQKELSDFGYSLKNIGSRGFSVDTGNPDISIVGTPHNEGGFMVSLQNHKRFDTDEQGNFKYPETWGDVKGHLPVAKEQLPHALMDWLTSPEVRKHINDPK